MPTTIQINQRTLQILKKLKEETNSSSYDETINKMMIEKTKKDSLAGCLKKYFIKKSISQIIKDIRDKNERF